MSTDNKIKIAVIGGGAAGLMAAGVALKYGADVTVFDHSGRLGKKLAITGKGRCNVTNNSAINDILENITVNPRFMYAPLNAFSPADTIEFFEGLGVPLKTERGNRVFPVSDKAFDIVDALKRYAEDAQKVYEHVKSVRPLDIGGFEVVSERSRIFDKVIIATGGKSYPLTGSDGSGYKLAMRLGHTVTELTPSLIPIESPSPLCLQMQGLSLKNVGISVADASGAVLYSDFGEMMFTHFGVTGPMILSASAHLKKQDISALKLRIDLKPALDEKTLNERILSDFSKNANKDFVNSLPALLPSKMIEPFIALSGIDGRKKVNAVTKEERHRFLSLLKGLPICVQGARPIAEAIITKGGVSLSEIAPRTMASKKAAGLYFAGEVLDLDAYTGGFNLQIAFCTAVLAGESAAIDALSE